MKRIAVCTIAMIMATVAGCSSKRAIVYEKKCRVIVGQESIKDRGEYTINEDCELKAKPDDG